MTALFDSFGYDVVDAGPPAEGWRYPPDTPASGLPYLADPSDWSKAKPAGADDVRTALAGAARPGNA